MKKHRRPSSRLERKARKGFQGNPIAVVAYYEAHEGRHGLLHFWGLSAEPAFPDPGGWRWTSGLRRHRIYMLHKYSW